MESANITELEILRALLCIFSKQVARWYHMVKLEVKTWQGFKHAFHRRFVKKYNWLDLLDDLLGRTQGKGKKVKAFKYIV